MKRTMKFFVVMAVTISASFVYASVSTFKANVIGENKLRVEVLDIKGSFTYSIKNMNGETLYADNSDSEELKMVFDLSHLADGTYELNVRDEFKTRALPVLIMDGKLSIIEKEMTKTFSPSIDQSDDLVTVKLISNKENDLSINVSSESGTPLVEDKIDGKLGLIGKRYQLVPGKYVVTVNSNDYSKISHIVVD